MRSVALPSGERIPALGQGTWGLAEQPSRRTDEIRSLREGIDLGLTLVDTAEMYANGAAEELVGEAIVGRRDEIFLVSKVLPHDGNADADAVATDQVLYNLTRRGIEYDLLPYCQQRGLPVMAYSPVEQGRMLGHPALVEVARRRRVSTAQVALAWVLRQDGVSTIPRTSTPAHVRDNHAALGLMLTDEDLATLDAAFPPPTSARPLEVL
ncbi:MAG: aldo/keto reductase [Sciscionella sp.]